LPGLPYKECSAFIMVLLIIKSAVRNGVAAQISSEEKHAIYTYCFGHSLNLAVRDYIKKNKVFF